MSNNIGQFLDANVWQFGEYKQLIYLGNGEEVAAVIVLKPGCAVTEEELLLYTSRHIHHFTALKKIFVMPSLPETGIGKIKKKEIRRIIDECH